MTGLQLFTLVHVTISLTAIASGLIVIGGFLTGSPLRLWNVLFLVMTTATSVTGFLFPFKGITPGIVVGAVSIVVLGFAVVAYRRRWTRAYIVSASIAEFLNVLVLITQLFEKVPILHRYAPTGAEPIVALVQLAALLSFTASTWIAIRGSRFVLG